MEHAPLWHGGSCLVPQLSLLHEIRQGGFFPRRVTAPCPSRGVQAEGCVLPRHPRTRPTRRSTIRRLGEASQPIARRTNVSGKSRGGRGVSGRQEFGNGIMSVNRLRHGDRAAAEPEWRPREDNDVGQVPAVQVLRRERERADIWV